MTTQKEEVDQILSGILGQVRQEYSRPQPTRGNQAWKQFYTPLQPPQSPNKGEADPSVLSRIFDVLSRPLYAASSGAIEVMDQGQEAAESGQSLPDTFVDFLNPASETSGDIRSALWQGLSGQNKTLGSDVIERATGERPNFGVGLAADIALDPLTYAGGLGLFSKIGSGGRAVQKSQQALGQVEDASKHGADELVARVTGATPEDVQQAQQILGNFGYQRPSARPQPPSTTHRSLPEELQTPVSAQPFPEVKLPRDVLRPIREESATGTLQKPTIAVPERFRDKPIDETLKEFLEYQRRGAGRANVGQRSPVADAAGVELLRTIGGKVTTKPSPEMPVAKSASDTERFAEAAKAAENFGSRNKYKNLDERGSSNLVQAMVSVANRTAGSQKARQFGAVAVVPRLVRIAEEALGDAGRTFKIDGHDLKPSEFFAEMEGVSKKELRSLLSDPTTKLRDAMKALATGDTSKLPKGEIKSRIDELSANRQNVQREIGEKSLQAAVARGSELSDNAVAAQAAMDRKALEDALGRIQKRAGASTDDIRKEKKFLDGILNPNISAPASSINTYARDIMNQVIRGKGEVNTHLNKSVYDTLQANPKVLGKVVGNNRAFEALMTRFVTWWGAKDLRPYWRETMDTARIGAAAFARAWAPLVRATGGPKSESLISSFKSVQGGLPPTTELEARAAQQFRDAFEKLLHSSNLTDEAARGNTVALRAGITMDELNNGLKATGWKGPLFTNAKDVKNSLGDAKDYSNNADWLKSWESMDIEDPVDFLYRAHLSLQRITRQNSMVDDFAARWGQQIKGGDFNKTIDHPRLQGWYFPKEIAEQANNMFNKLFDPANYRSQNELLKLYDKSLGAFKSGVTIYSPSHHIRNAIGDIWLGALDGNLSPRNYFDASRVLASQRRRYKDSMPNVMDITDPDAAKRAMANPGDTILTTKGKQKLTAEQIYTLAFNQGILPRASFIEDIVESGGRLIPDLPITQGRVRETAHSASELRDHYTRLSHFIHVLRTSKTKDVQKLAQEAGQRVKRYHPDGMDLTEFEHKVMRRLIPFYSWIRKSTPLIVEAMVQRPSLVVAYPRAMMEVQRDFGIEPTASLADPFPVDQMFPEWIRDKGVGPILTPESGLGSLARQEPPGYAMLNPGNPFNDSVGDMADPWRFLKSSLTPHLSLPASLYSGADPLGIPIENPIEYTAKQVAPPLATGSRITGQTRPDESFSPEQLIRWLTAAGLIGTGPYKQQARFEEAEKRKEEAGR